MNEEMEQLIRLQKIDHQLSRFKEKEQGCQEKILKEQESLSAVRSKLDEAQKQFEQVSKERKDKEKEMEDHEIRIQKTQGRLKEIKSNKEYQAHLHEIDALKRGRGALEETLLSLMDRMEILGNETATEKGLFAESERQFAATVQQIEQELEQLKKEKAVLEEEREKLASRVNKKVLAQYEHLLATRKGNALAGVSGSTCLGCNMNLPPQLVAEVKKNEKLLACSQCYRILYWQENYSPKTA